MMRSIRIPSENILDICEVKMGSVDLDNAVTVIKVVVTVGGLLLKVLPIIAGIVL